MRVVIALFISLIVCHCTIVAAGPQDTQSKDNDKVPVIQLTLRPAAEPQPSLKYRLLPPVWEQTAGNAALLYDPAVAAVREKDNAELRERIDEFLQKPLNELPRREILNLSDQFSNELSYVELAGRRQRCDWEPPVSMGYQMLLPELSQLRTLGKIVALKARLEISEGKYDEAIHTLQTGFALARHIAEGPTVIEALVSAGITQVMLLDQVKELIQAPDAPNLYWALTALPRPFIDIHRCMEFEISLSWVAGEIGDLKKSHCSPEEAQGFLEKMIEMGFQLGPGNQELKNKLFVTGLVVKTYPAAKRHLIEQGRSAAEVNAMSVAQVVLIYYWDTSQPLRDQIVRWFYVPYWQAREGLFRAGAALSDQSSADNPFLRLLPVGSKLYLATTKIDRTIAAFRCIEALRLYAANHDGGLPTSLNEIKDVPIPIDPTTGHAFEYKLEGGRGILESASPTGFPPKDGIRYELILAK